ncbi:MFS transporter like protein, partial [Zymoseptoria brevis]
MNFWTKYVVPKDRSTSLPMPDLNTVDINDKAIERRIATPAPSTTTTPTSNILTQLSLTGQRYNIVVALFFVPYVLAEFPSNLALKYFSPSKWIARIMVSWGIVTICTAAVSTYGGLITVRIFLGLAEAGFFPGNARPAWAIFASSVAVAGAFSGLLATAISFLNGRAGLSGWQWLFILEGIPSVLVGVAVFKYLPDWPQTAHWLTPSERAFAVKRLGPYAPSMNDKHFDAKVAKDTLCNGMFWLYAAQYFLMTNSLHAFGYFAPTIVASLGFSVALVVMVGNCVHSDRTQERSRHILAALGLVGTGYLLLAVVHNWGVRYFAVCRIACTNAAVMPFVAHRTATISGSTATALATGGMIALANTGGITAPFLFPSDTGPMYAMGKWTIFAFLVVAAGMTGCTWWVYGSYAGYRVEGVGTEGRVE